MLLILLSFLVAVQWLNHVWLSGTLWLPCPSVSPGACSNSCSLSRWCHPTISSSVTPLLPLPSIFPRVFSILSSFHIRWPKYWSFSFSVEKVMAPHSSTFAWKIPWMEEPVGCSPWGRWVGHNWAISLSLFTFMHWRRKQQPTPVFLPGESQGRGTLVGCHLWGCTVGHDWSDLAAVSQFGTSLLFHFLF